MRILGGTIFFKDKVVIDTVLHPALAWQAPSIPGLHDTYLSNQTA